MTPPQNRRGKRPRTGASTPAGGKARPASSTVDQARHAAYEVVRAVSARDAYANLTLGNVLADRAVHGRDAAFATELAHGTLRLRGTYDQVLAAGVDRPLERLDPEVVDLLRIGTHQLLGMRVPAHAAVATTVDLAREVVGRGASGFVNAVLRRVGRRDFEAWIQELAPAYDDDPIGYLAVAHGHPRWIAAAVHERLDGALEQTAEALAADNEPARVTLVARPGRSTVSELLEAGAEPGLWSRYAAVLASGDPRHIPAVAEGRAGVQDEGSQLVAVALAHAPLTGAGDARWLDLCAGPGGKAALLAGLAAEREAHVIAVERSRHRTELVAKTLRDSPGVAGVVCADGTRPPWGPEVADRVLVDAPCTGLGALRRRPEARWRRTADDLDALTQLQRDLLVAAIDQVRVGGVVAYVTCSPHRAETEEVVRSVLGADEAGVESIDARPLVGDLPDLGPGPDVQLWPHRHGTDAMYLALLRRTR